jgi:hypothetical protein
LLRLAQVADGAINDWNAAAAAAPDIVQYTKDEKQDQGLDVIAEFNGMKDAAVEMRDEITSTVPAPTSIEDDGSYATMTFSTAQTIDLRTAIDAFLATVDAG